MRKRHVAMIMACIFLGMCGCAGKAVKKSTPDPSLVMLKKKADQIQKQLNQLSEIKKYEARKERGFQKVRSYSSKEIDGELSSRISFHWAGPLKYAVETLSDKVGYTFKVRGEEPEQSVIVVINKDNAKIFDILEEIGWKAGSNAELIVNENDRIIQLTYIRSKT